MAVNLPKKQTKKESATKQVVKALDKTAESDVPFLKQDEDLAIIGNATKTISEQNKTEYEVLFVFPKDLFETDEFGDTVIYENDELFTVRTTATQEPINANNRSFYLLIASAFISQLFYQDEDGNMEMLTEDKLAYGIVRIFREEELVENAKFFVGKMLGIDEKYIPYINDRRMMPVLINLITENPSLMNEAYFVEK